MRSLRIGVLELPHSIERGISYHRTPSFVDSVKEHGCFAKRFAAPSDTLKKHLSDVTTLLISNANRLTIRLPNLC